MSACQRQGAELAWPDNRVLKKLEQDFIAFGVFGEFHGKSSYWSGMENRIYSYKRTRSWYYRNKRCGAYRSLLYLDYGQSFKPSCAAPRHFVCELKKVSWIQRTSHEAGLLSCSHTRRSFETCRYGFPTSQWPIKRCTVTQFAVFMLIFLWSKIVARWLEASAPANAGIGRTFLYFKLEASRSTSKWVEQLQKSFISRTKSTSGFENWSRKWERKDSAKLPNNGGHEQWKNAWRPQATELHGLIFSCLGPTIVQASPS